jgi:divalent metal cation (Fe/Co/Zn/Cd) transporter
MSLSSHQLSSVSTVLQSHHIAEQLRHDLFHQIPNLAEVVVHVDPWAEQLETVHQLTTHHEPIPQPLVASH